MTSRNISLPRGFRQYIAGRPNCLAVLFALLQTHTPMTGRGIADAAGIPPTAIQPILCRFRFDGIVRKIKREGRETPAYELTPRGRQALEQEPEVLQV